VVNFAGSELEPGCTKVLLSSVPSFCFCFSYGSVLSMHISLLTLLKFSLQKDLTAVVGVNELTVQCICTCECYLITEWVRRLQSPLASNKT
jgi:hypothetical protein